MAEHNPEHRALDRRAAAEARRSRRATVTEPGPVMEAAAALLAARARSVAEMRRRLRRLGYQESLVEVVLERLVALGYLDDAAFARAWVESRDRSRPRGSAALRLELRRMGLDDAAVRGALAARAAGTPEDGSGAPPASRDADAGSADHAAAERLLARKAPVLARESDPRRRRQKAYALLARNGFDPEVCREASVAAVVDPDPAETLDDGSGPDGWQLALAEGP